MAIVISIPKKAVTQFIKFCMIGVSNTFVHLCIYYLLLWLNVYYLISYIVAFVFSVLNSYFLNKRFVFSCGKTTLFILIRLYAAYGMTTLLGIGLLYFLVDIISLSKYLSPIINIGIMTIVNYILNKYFVFMDSK